MLDRACYAEHAGWFGEGAVVSLQQQLLRLGESAIEQATSDMLTQALCHMVLQGNTMQDSWLQGAYRVEVASKVHQVVNRQMADVSHASIRGVCSLEVAVAVV